MVSDRDSPWAPNIPHPMPYVISACQREDRNHTQMDYLAQIDHFPKSACSNELAQESRSDSTELSITARPLCSMRNEPSRVTWPSLRAATLYCLAVSRTAASFDGVTETM